MILASGTLCPTETFKTELGIEFKLHMEGDQVISKDRIFAAAIAKVFALHFVYSLEGG